MRVTIFQSYNSPILTIDPVALLAVSYSFQSYNSPILT